MESKNKKIVKINEDSLVELICNIVDKRVAEELKKAKPGLKETKAPVVKKITVTESQLRALQAKGAKINSIVKKNVAKRS